MKPDPVRMATWTAATTVCAWWAWCLYCAGWLVLAGPAAWTGPRVIAGVMGMGGLVLTGVLGVAWWIAESRHRRDMNRTIDRHLEGRRHERS